MRAGAARDDQGAARHAPAPGGGTEGYTRGYWHRAAAWQGSDERSLGAGVDTDRDMTAASKCLETVLTDARTRPAEEHRQEVDGDSVNGEEHTWESWEIG